MNPDSIRCFVAVEIPDRIQDLLLMIQQNFRKEIFASSWTKKGNYHLTLKFLGGVEEQKIDRIRTVLDSIAAVNSPFSVEIGGIGVFPNWERPRVLWVGLKQGGIQIKTLAKTINNELISLDFPQDTRFTPHFTLARFKKQIDLKAYTDLLMKYNTLDNAKFKVKDFAIIRSKLRPTGAVYSPLSNFQLDKEYVDNGK